MTKGWWLLLVACKGDPPPAPPPTEPAPIIETKPLPPPAKPPAFALPPVDTATWKPIALSKLGRDKFPFAGTLMIPPGSKTSTSAMFTSDHKPAGMLAYVTLPDGVKVMMTVRTALSEKDPTTLKQLLASTGTVVLERKDPTGYMIALQDESGLVVQGAMWPVEPGLDCATEKALTPAQLAETIAVCTSLTK